jgi:diguanylate cyclase (GGDEF)-like protein
LTYENQAQFANVPEVTVAFQPIVNIHSGQTFGFEILARGPAGTIEEPPLSLFDCDAEPADLTRWEIVIRNKAAEAAMLLPHLAQRRLFFNIDHRLTERWDSILATAQQLFPPGKFQLVSEITGLPETDDAVAKVRNLRTKGSLVAVDRFGIDINGLRLLQHCDLDFVKSHRDHVRDIDKMPRKRVIFAQMVSIAHTLGIQVIAVGVETAGELSVCRELGCDLVQGFYIQPPTRNPSEVGTIFPHVEELANRYRSGRLIDQKWILDQLDTTPPLLADASMETVFARVAQEPDRPVLPVINRDGHPLGVIYERRLRNYAYSAFGKELIANRSLGRVLSSFIDRCPMADIGTPLAQLLAVFSTDQDASGIVVTERMLYRGFLSARSLIRAAHEKNLARARDENPLTRLPGNLQIHDYITKLLMQHESAVLAYIDFDNFKPFNDTYGFRQGDRAILLFAEIMRKTANSDSWFLGHIGGDDFFVGMTRITIEDAIQQVADMIEKFSSDAQSFYEAGDRAQGYITGYDRDGKQRPFPLLTASAVVLEIEEYSPFSTVDEVSEAIAFYKKKAKIAPGKLVVAPPQLAPGRGGQG